MTTNYTYKNANAGGKKRWTMKEGGKGRRRKV